MARRSLFDDDVYREIRERIDRLEPDAKREWGTMSPAQMLAHCSEVVEVANGKDLEGTPFYVKLLGPLIKRMIVSEKPFPKKGKTHPQYEVHDPKDFQAQKERLVSAIDELRSGGASPREHPLMGRMSAEEVGWGNYKHLDHHLRQFGV